MPNLEHFCQLLSKKPLRLSGPTKSPYQFFLCKVDCYNFRSNLFFNPGNIHQSILNNCTAFSSSQSISVPPSGWHCPATGQQLSALAVHSLFQFFQFLACHGVQCAFSLAKQHLCLAQLHSDLFRLPRYLPLNWSNPNTSFGSDFWGRSIFGWERCGFASFPGVV